MPSNFLATSQLPVPGRGAILLNGSRPRTVRGVQAHSNVLKIASETLTAKCGRNASKTVKYGKSASHIPLTCRTANLSHKSQHDRSRDRTCFNNTTHGRCIPLTNRAYHPRRTYTNTVEFIPISHHINFAVRYQLSS